MIDPDYDSMADYVDAESITLSDALKEVAVSAASRLFRPSHEIIHAFPCSGMLQKMQDFQQALHG